MNNAIFFLKETFIKDGFFSLWRGNSATMARIIPYAAIQFTAHEQWKKILHVDTSGRTPGKQFVAGSLAGVTSQSLTYPLDLARARMAVFQKQEYATLRQVIYPLYKILRKVYEIIVNATFTFIFLYCSRFSLKFTKQRVYLHFIEVTSLRYLVLFLMPEFHSLHMIL